MIIPSKEGNNINDKTKGYNMIDEFHVMYIYKKIQVEALLLILTIEPTVEGLPQSSSYT